MKKFFFLIFLLSVGSKNFPQSKFSSHATQLQLEAFGPGSLFSVNIDSRFGKKENGLGFRVGIGGTPLGLFGDACNKGSLNTFPLGINYLAGKNKHLLELGAGGVLLFMAGTKRYCSDLGKGFFGDEAEPYLFLTTGYRYQPFKRKGLTYRAFVSPLFQKGFSPKLWAGASIGYRF